MSAALPKPRLVFRCQLQDYPTALQWGAGYLAAADAQGELHIYRPDGQRQRQVMAHPGGVLAVACQPDTQQLASSGQDGQVLLWSLDGDLMPLRLPQSGQWVESLAWSPDGHWLALGCGRVAALYNASGQFVGATASHPATVADIAWSPDGRYLATGGYQGARLWNVPELTLAHNLFWQGALLHLAWSPHGHILAAGCQDRTVHFWYIADGNDAMMAGYPLKPSGLSWSPDNNWLATTGSSDVTLWPFDPPGPEGRRPLLLELHEAPVSAVAFAPHRPWLASACRDGYVALWRVGEGDEPVQGLQMREQVVALAWSQLGDDLLLAAAAANGDIGVWHCESMPMTV